MSKMAELLRKTLEPAAQSAQPHLPTPLPANSDAPPAEPTEMRFHAIEVVRDQGSPPDWLLDV